MNGFLAGIFDAEGGYSQGAFRITNTDEQILSHIQKGLSMFNFRYCIEEPEKATTKAY